MEWIARPRANEDKVLHLRETIGAPELVARILVQRGITEPDQVREYFNPKLSQLHDPYLMLGMEEAVARILLALEQDEGVLIFGDYDVDGTTSVALIYSFFKSYFAGSEYYIPDRYKEGYGISKEGIDHAHKNGYSLIIALDCGIRSVELVEYAAGLGIDFIICDHHLPGDELPRAVAVLDPKQPGCEYPYKELSGCGIGFKLIQAFCQKQEIEDKYYLQYLDLLALSIASDLVPVTGENRVLAYYGLKLLSQRPTPGMQALIDVSVKKEKMSIGDLVFYLGPRINAAGRMGHASKAVELLVEEDVTQARHLASELHELNAERKEVDEGIKDDIQEMVKKQPGLLDGKTLIFYHEKWHKGVVGIAASRAVELYHRPTIILTRSNGVLTGSARSISGFDIHDALLHCTDHLLQFGGTQICGWHDAEGGTVGWAETGF